MKPKCADTNANWNIYLVTNFDLQVLDNAHVCMYIIIIGCGSWVSFTYTVVMCVLVIVAPPIVMGVWSMAFLLRQHVEYYYKLYLCW